jgi:hypothetical protein
MAGAAMDMKNTVKSFIRIGGSDPLRPLHSVKRALRYIKRIEFDKKVYSAQFLGTQIDKTARIRAPNCIFLPEKQMFKRMVRAFHKYGKEDSEETFLLRFGLVDGPPH